jgi:hypothetical protein
MIHQRQALTSFEYTNGCRAEYVLGKQRTDALAQATTLDQMAALLVLKRSGKQSGFALDIAIHAVAAARRHSVPVEACDVGTNPNALEELLPRLRALSLGPRANLDRFLLNTIGPVALERVPLDDVDVAEKAEMATRVAFAELDHAPVAGPEIRFLQSECLMARSAQELSRAAALAVQHVLPELEFRDYAKLSAN